MKFVSALLSILYLGTLYLVHAEKRNIRRLSTPHTKTNQTEPITVGITLSALEESGEVDGEIHSEVDGEVHIEVHSEVHSIHDDTTIAEQPPSNRKLGTVTDFNAVGKGAAIPAVEETVVVVESNYPKKQYSGPSGSGPSGSGPSKGGRYHGGYGGSSGKGKGKRYGYYHGGSSYSKGKGKGGRYNYHGGQRASVIGTTTVVKEVVEEVAPVPVGKGAH